MSTQNRKRRDKKKMTSSTMLVIVFILITVPFIFNAVNFYIQKTKLELRKNELISQINDEEEKKQLYMEEIGKIGTPEYYEYLARRYLGYIYPDEKVMIVVDPQKDKQ